MAYGLVGNYKTLLPPLTNEADASELLVNTQLIDSNYHVVNGTMPNRGAVNTTITNQNQVYTVPNGYHNGQGKVTANITNLTGANIKDGVTVGGVQGSFTSDGNITPEDIPTGKIGYSQGQRIVGIGGSIFDLGKPSFFHMWDGSSSNYDEIDFSQYDNILLLFILYGSANSSWDVSKYGGGEYIIVTASRTVPGVKFCEIIKRTNRYAFIQYGQERLSSPNGVFRFSGITDSNMFGAIVGFTPV